MNSKELNPVEAYIKQLTDQYDDGSIGEKKDNAQDRKSKDNTQDRKAQELNPVEKYIKKLTDEYDETEQLQKYGSMKDRIGDIIAAERVVKEERREMNLGGGVLNVGRSQDKLMGKWKVIRLGHL